MTDQKDRNPIEVLAAEFVERHRRGEHPTVTEYAERNPELAGAIEDLFPTILAMERLKAHKESSSTPRRNLVGPNLNERLGDYILLREIGRGGMGIVYEAEQESLGRRVALKVLPHQSLDEEKKLKRFQQEAQTAARLHHTNIVPIFGVGEQDGFHYYVMQFIPGLGLDKVLKAMRKGESGSGSSNVSAAQADVDSPMLPPAQAVQALRSGCFQRRQETASSSSHEELPTKSATDATDAPDADTDAGTDTDAGSRSQPGGREATASDHRYWQGVARIGVQVGNALDYAHGRGTLHRDIKPANLILDAYGVVWVTDFGLAKVVEQVHLTRSGDVVGTLQYMAPEQFHGNYDARSDIYCLGLTLYELLTLQPAHADTSRSGLIHKVTRGTPSPPRKLRPGIPNDLEVIVLKAISREPSHRYQTAAELTEDLENFLEDRPINARRTTAIEHAWRWCRRNKAVASLSLVALLLLIATTVVGYVGWVMTSTAYEKESQSAKRAEENLELSLRAFADIFDDIAGGDRLQPVTEDTNSTELESLGGAESTDAIQRPLVARTVVSEQDAALLQKILRFYDRFADANAGNKSLQEETAKAHYRIGKIHLGLRQLDRAEQALRNALSMYEELGQKESAGNGYRDEIAAIYNDLGRTLQNRPRRRGPSEAWERFLTEARQQHLKVLALMGVDPASREAVERVTPDTVRGQYELARAYRYLASPPWALRPRPRRPDGSARGRPPEPRPAADRPTPSSRRSRREWDRAERQQRRERNLKWQERSLELIEGLLAKDPESHHFRLAKAMSCRTLARYAGEPAAAAARQAEAVRVLQTLAEDFPSAGQFRHELAVTLATPLGWRRRGSVEPTTRAQHLQQATAIGEQLIREFPTVTTYKWSLADHCSGLGQVQQRLGKNEEAEASCRRAIELREQLSNLPGESSWARLRLVDDRVRLARVFIANKKAAEAVQELETCLAAIPDPGDTDGKDGSARSRRPPIHLYWVHREMAKAIRLLGKDKEALARDHDNKAEKIAERWGWARGRSWGRGRGRDRGRDRDERR